MNSKPVISHEYQASVSTASVSAPTSRFPTCLSSHPDFLQWWTVCGHASQINPTWFWLWCFITPIVILTRTIVVNSQWGVYIIPIIIITSIQETLWKRNEKRTVRRGWERYRKMLSSAHDIAIAIVISQQLWLQHKIHTRAIHSKSWYKWNRWFPVLLCPGELLAVDGCRGRKIILHWSCGHG